ncbi:MAG: C4-type zinc ribbon domain-containing protein [Candidatus Kapabacteria bacterium]|nr:C4-type zinc ribbon domain-containing protein [Candidatus Kapabacteria bacterium]
MESQIHYLAALSYVDVRLDELKEEFGDLPSQLKEREKKVNQTQSLVKETEEILNDIRRFLSTSSISMREMKDKEDKLSKQQFMAKNNKEFDAIQKEIAFLKDEYAKLTEKGRSESMKQDNLVAILETQKNDLQEAEKNLTEKQSEFETLASDQNEEVKELFRIRKAIMENIGEEFMAAYHRVRKYHTEAVARVKKNSCMGCFSAVPPQKIVEMRNNLDTIYACEHCGRIIHSEDIIINDDTLEAF